MNRYLKNLNKIEFVVTYACTGRCKHCSEGDHKSCGERIDPQVTADAVRKIRATCAVCRLSRTATFSAATCMSEILWEL